MRWDAHFPLSRRAVTAGLGLLMMGACKTPTEPLPPPPETQYPASDDGAYRYDFGGEIGSA